MRVLYYEPGKEQLTTKRTKKHEGKQGLQEDLPKVRLTWQMAAEGTKTH
jgi:hypothetical protein